MANNNQKTEQALISKVDNIANVLASAGVGYTDYLTQLTYLLFLKMDEEKEQYGLGSILPDDCKWSALKKASGEDLVVKYNEILAKLSKESGLVGTIFTGASSKIDRPNHLKTLIDMISSENWYIMDGDVKGAIYESVLEKNGQDKKSGAGQYFTPRSLIKAMVEVVDPKPYETIADPACGTGGFLLGAYDHVKSQIHADADKSDFLRNDTFFGADNTPLVVTLASMNMYLHDIGVDKSPIVCMDSLTDKTDRMFDVILANPPFGTRPQGTIDVSSCRPEFVKTSDNQVNFLQHIMTLVKTGGRVGVVLPDSVLTASGATAKVRDKLLKEFNLHTILRLPTGIFYAIGVKANVLFFEKGTPTTDIWMYDYRAGIHHTMVQNPLKREDLQDFVDCYCSGHMQDRKETYSTDNPTGRWHKFTIDQVRDNKDLKIDFKWLQFDDEDDRTIPELLTDMNDKVANIADAIAQLNSMLSNIED